MCIGARTCGHIREGMGGSDKRLKRLGFEYPLCDLDLGLLSLSLRARHPVHAKATCPARGLGPRRGVAAPTPAAPPGRATGTSRRRPGPARPIALVRPSLDCSCPGLPGAAVRLAPRMWGSPCRLWSVPPFILHRCFCPESCPHLTPSSLLFRGDPKPARGDLRHGMYLQRKR